MVRRRRLLRWGVPIVLVLVAGGVAAATVGTDARGGGPAGELSTVPATRVTEPSNSGESGRLVTDDGATAVAEVWLLDRGDGRYDWGAVISSDDNVARRDLAVVASVFDSDGVAVFVDEVRIAQLDPGGRAAIGGVFPGEGLEPARVEVIATVGDAAPDAPAVVLAVSDVRRVLSGQVDRDDRLLGSVDVVDGDPSALRVGSLWRDESGSVVAAAFDVVDVGVPGEPVNFSIRLPRSIVPGDEPDEVLAHAAAVN